MPITAGAAAAIAGGQTVSNIVGGAISAKKNYKYTKKLQEAQNAWQEKMWDKTNEYNTPSAQAERYRAAGINPALAATDGALNAGNADSAGAAGSSQFDGFDFGNVGSQFMDSLLATSQLNKIDSEVRNTNSLTDKNLLDLLFGRKTLSWRIRGEQGFQLAREKSIDTLNNDLTLQQWEIKQRQQDYVTGSIQQEILQSNLPWLKGQEQFRLANLMSNTYMQIASGDLSYKQCKKLMTDMLVNYATVSLYKHQGRYYDSASSSNYAQAFYYNEKGLSEHEYRNNGGYDPQKLKNIETKAQKELHQFMTEVNFKFKKKEWLQNPHAWIQDVNNIAHSVSEFMPWKLSSGGYSSQSFDYSSYAGFGVPSSTR